MMISEGEFASIVGQTKQVVLRAIYKTLPARYYHAVDDIVQETYIRAYRKLKSKKDLQSEKLKSWLFVISKNETLRMIKKIKGEEAKSDKLMETDKDSLFARDNQFWDEYETDRINQIINRLPEKYSEVFHLFLQGLKEREISKRLNIPAGTVKSRLSRGKEKLYKLIKGGDNDKF